MAVPYSMDAPPAGTASFYGVELLIGDVQQWTFDWAGSGYYADPASLVDPQGPPTGTHRVLHGNHCVSQQGVAVAYRTTRMGLESQVTGFRCARPVLE